VVIGSWPNGLATAIIMAQAGRSVLVLEAEDTICGGTRSACLTLRGYLHDVCSAVHPMALASPFFSSLPLAKHGLEWIRPRFPLAHPLKKEIFETANENNSPQRSTLRSWLDLFFRPVN
jgi:phytoene dehydrogenase-like protein